MSRPLFRAGEFIALAEPAKITWGPRSDFADLLPLLALPIGDSEMLNLSHYAPIAIHLPDDERAIPIVVILLHPALTRVSPFDGQGKWLPPYQPLALRSLPFTPDDCGNCLYAPDLVMIDGHPGSHSHDADGRQSKEYRLMLDLVQRLYNGSRWLSDAARLLLSAGVLAPLEAIPEQGNSRLYVLNANRLAAVEPVCAAGLTAFSMLPMELAAALLFSSRYLARRLDANAADGYAGPVFNASARAEMSELLPPDLMAGRYILDAGSLFNFEAFDQASAGKV